MSFSTILWALFLVYAGYLLISSAMRGLEAAQQLELIASHQQQGIEWLKPFLQYLPLAKQLGTHIQISELDAQAETRTVPLILSVGLSLTIVLWGVGIIIHSYTCIILTILIAMVIRYFFKLTVTTATLPMSVLINNSPTLEHLHLQGHRAITLQLGEVIRIKEQMQKTSSAEEQKKLGAELIFEPFALIQALENKKVSAAPDTLSQIHNLQFLIALITRLVDEQADATQFHESYAQLSDHANQVIADLATVPK